MEVPEVHTRLRVEEESVKGFEECFLKEVTESGTKVEGVGSRWL